MAGFQRALPTKRLKGGILKGGPFNPRDRRGQRPPPVFELMGFTEPRMAPGGMLACQETHPAGV